MTSLTDSSKRDLSAFLQQIKDGTIQLPDFQREWRWKNTKVRRLLASVSLSYPIGAVMLLKTGNPNVRFKQRLIEGVDIDNPPEPDSLILDGQQRLTALYQALFSDKPVSTIGSRQRQLKVWYYIDIAKAVESDFRERDEAIIEIPENKKLAKSGQPTLDLSSSEKEYENGLFPLRYIFDPIDWGAGYERFWSGENEDKIGIYRRFQREIIKQFDKYELPYIELSKETPRAAVCQVFQRLNTANESLNVFDLLTAKFAVDNFQLRENWSELKQELTGEQEAHVLQSLTNMAFLTAITLLATAKSGKPGCRSEDINEVTLEEYQHWATKVSEALKNATRLLYELKIFRDKDVPYPTQLVSLAVILVKLGENFRKAGVRRNIIRWYWCGVFSEEYGRNFELTLLGDLEVPNWCIGKDISEPNIIKSAKFTDSRLVNLSTRNSASYRGISALLMHDGCRDFLTGETIDLQKYFDDEIDIHHIFPRDWCKEEGIDSKRCNSIINKTPLAYSTNRKIGNKPPSKYLRLIMKENNLSKDDMDEILRSHAIEPETLWRDDFQSFFKKRKEALLIRIESAMGKPVTRDSVEQKDESDAFEEEEIESQLSQLPLLELDF